MVVAASVFLLNLLVLILKVVLGRGQPEAADPAFFVGGLAYPSGHTANIVLVYGLVAFVLSRYRQVNRTLVRVLWSAVGLLSLTMVVTSLTLNWHWFADLIAGLLVGGVVLQLTAAVDTAVPDHALSGGARHLLRRLRGRVAGCAAVGAGGRRRRTSHGPASPPAPAAPPAAPRQDA